MSVKTVKTFFEKVEGDKVLQEKMKALATKYRGQKDAEVAALVSTAAEAGIVFTVADSLDARSQAEELSQDEVKEITAGARDCPFGYKCGLMIRF